MKKTNNLLFFILLFFFVLANQSFVANASSFDDKISKIQGEISNDEVKEANYQTTSVYGFGHSLYYNNVVEVLRGNTEPETDGREGLKSLEVLIAAYLSARDGETISLPLKY